MPVTACKPKTPKRFPMLCICLLTLALALPVCARAADEDDEDVWTKFGEIARDSFYEKLDEQFADISGVNLKDKIDKMNLAIDTVDKFVSYYDNVLTAEPSRKANLDVLQGIADGISAVAVIAESLPEPGPSLAAFFNFYAQGIGAAVRMMGRLSEIQRQRAIELAELSQWRFSLYPGAITDEELQAIRDMVRQERLAKMAQAAAVAKKAHLEAKLAQIQSFSPDGYGDFVAAFLQDVVAQAEQVVYNAYSLSRRVRQLKGAYPLVFARASPRDALEIQYTDELAVIYDEARTTLTGAGAYRVLLIQGRSLCSAALSALDSVVELPDRGDDSVRRSDIGTLQVAIDELEQRSHDFDLTAATTAEMMDALVEIEDHFSAILTEAEGLEQQARQALAEAQTYVQEALDAWEEAAAADDTVTAGTPYDIQLTLGAASLASDAAVAALLGYPRETDLSVTVPTVLARQKLVEEEDPPGSGQMVHRRYYEFTEGAEITTATLDVQPRNVVAVGSDSVTGSNPGRTTIQASVFGYTQKPGGLYLPADYQALEKGTLTDSLSVDVHAYTGMRFEACSLTTLLHTNYINRTRGCETRYVDLFLPTVPAISTGTAAVVDIYFEFQGPDGYHQLETDWFDLEELESHVAVTHSDELVLPPENCYWLGNNYVNHGYGLAGGQTGSSTLEFSVLDDNGTAVASDQVAVTVNSVTLQINTMTDHLTWHGRAGELTEARLVIDGDADLSRYDVTWFGYAADPGPVEAHFVEQVTRFRGNHSMNYGVLPPGAHFSGPSTGYAISRQDLECAPGGMGFFRAYPSMNMKVYAPELQRLELKLRHRQSVNGLWLPDPDAPLFLPAELHLFEGFNGRYRWVDIVKEGYYSSLLIPLADLTEHNVQVQKQPPGVNECARLYCSSPTCFGPSAVYRFPSQTGCAGSLSLWAPVADETSTGFYNPVEMFSLNVLDYYADELRLSAAGGGTTVGAGRVTRLVVSADTLGELTGYVAEWTLEPPVGTLFEPVTPFYRHNGGWQAHTSWYVPPEAEGSNVTVSAMVRTRASNILLGGTDEDLTVGPLACGGLDVNGNGSIELIDALLCFQVDAGMLPTDEICLSADANADGRIDRIDGIVVLRALAQP